MINQQQTVLIWCMCLCLLLQACVPSPPVNQTQNPLITVPKTYPEYSRQSPRLSDSSKTQQSNSTADKNWQDFFTDKHLNTLIKTALEHNQELKILEQEIQIANNDIIARQGKYYPKLRGGFSYQVEKFGEFTSEGAGDAATEFLPVPTVPTVLHNHQAGLLTTWEIDIWKKLRNATRSAYYRYLASIEVKKFMVTHLVAEIATTYYELIALDNQLQIVTQFIHTLKRAQEVANIQKSSARTTSLAVKRFEAEVFKNQSRIYKIKQEIIIHENKLNALVGRFPQQVTRSPKQLDELIPKEFKTGVPFRLLENRPDVKRSSLELMASKIDIEVAKARFLPSLGIEAGTGYEAFSGQYFITPESIFYNMAANVTLPLLNRQAIKAAYFTANNKQIQSIYNYNLTVLNAYKEVANQLATINNLNKTYQLRLKQVKVLTESVDIANMLFQAARVDYLESLLTQRDLLEAQIELVEIKRDQFTAYIALYKALGGGWRDNARVNC
ncbi:TolC family protein [Legionella oakridgensis]|uniref:Efflux transporter, outer membrane factor OMF lipoprotein, NodT family n=2 Tax=Legionella oakridgensis TaxID=29423 RepID=W0BDS0_9GAMM|nr:efflux transporter outer membrane subunit [Legionella oakridgensis]AHE66826.1 efflux transporter, outer membrane factor OMF lipoprotein, NodT family [Legionella oakridgensis ATCC 33761 = DSM 21215]KTD39782.1 multidrug efflux MFS outer membrane protein [Legionella oakridgensis]STY19939.1 multidrug efflux MFS outer membrane protein [Legionella longbeachae]